MKPLVIYHANCIDGFTAAWCFHHAAKDPDNAGLHGIEFLPASYGQEPPDVTGRLVYIVDFSYPRAQLYQMADRAKLVVVLDHHQSAQADLEALRGPGLKIHFDMQRSGAGMAWDYLFDGAPRPRFLGFVEDRDLWRFSFDETKASHAYLGSVDRTFAKWDEIMLGNAFQQATALAQGAALVRLVEKQVADAVRSTLRTAEIGGQVVPLANVPGFLASDAGHSMNDGVPFAATYFDTEQRRCFSLRSRPDGADVSLVAQQYGGGGHKHAAGFTVPREHELARA
jgi:oligoribonuclease NrnB/cAMP/cGMP phosphodiesterase (DHH superfamily)